MKIVLAQSFNEGKDLSVIIEDDDGRPIQLIASAQELVGLKTRQGSKKNRQSKSAGRNFSRVVGLVRGCVRSGRWPNGALYPADVAVTKLCTTYWTLQQFERLDVTANAIVGLQEILARTSNQAVGDVLEDLFKLKVAK